MIKAHLYARHSGTAVYHRPNSSETPVCRLQKGDWVGVAERRSGDWIRIISMSCDGWVKAADLESRPPMHLHVHWTPNHPIQYVNAP